jgi:hypothetical protein
VNLIGRLRKVDQFELILIEGKLTINLHTSSRQKPRLLRKLTARTVNLGLDPQTGNKAFARIPSLEKQHDKGQGNHVIRSSEFYLVFK